MKIDLDKKFQDQVKEILKKAKENLKEANEKISNFNDFNNEEIYDYYNKIESMVSDLDDLIDSAWQTSTTVCW
jgi:adenylosuccinate synthase